MARIHDRDWTPDRLAALVAERFQPIPPHRVLSADQPTDCRFRRLPLTAEEEYERAVAHGRLLGDTPADFAARTAFLEDLVDVAPAPLSYFRRVA